MSQRLAQMDVEGSDARSELSYKKLGPSSRINETCVQRHAKTCAQIEYDSCVQRHESVLRKMFSPKQRKVKLLLFLFSMLLGARPVQLKSSWGKVSTTKNKLGRNWLAERFCFIPARYFNRWSASGLRSSWGRPVHLISSWGKFSGRAILFYSRRVLRITAKGCIRI